MKNKKIFKTLSALCAALVLMMGLSVTAFAQGTEELPAEDATNDSNVVVEETEDSPALTPDGNAALVDDFGDNKQLITVTTKAGNYFYILIDLTLIHIWTASAVWQAAATQRPSISRTSTISSRRTRTRQQSSRAGAISSTTSTAPSSSSCPF